MARVFVPGGRPTVTYVPRSGLTLEEQLKNYLRDRYKILSVSGPTKCGKTVLLKSHLDDARWFSGGAIESDEGFWSAVCEEFDISLETGLDGVLSATEGSSLSGGANAGVVTAGATGQESVTRGRTQVSRKRHSPRDAGRAYLRQNLEEVLVIDDFHYIPSSIQLTIVRNLKDLVFEGLRVIVAAVPHRAYDVVKIEREMTGRVQQLPVEFWDLEDLQRIAEQGFNALRVSAPSELTDRLSREAFESPHLMQEFCRELCYANGIEETQAEERNLRGPIGDEFFRRIAPNTSKTMFDLLAKGPRQRADRIQRQLQNGTTTDIYGAVLAAIAATGPRTAIRYEELRSALKDVLSGAIPQAHEITNVLGQMTKIAKDADGEPVVEYDADYSTLHIADPYFAYWLRWGSHGASS